MCRRRLSAGGAVDAGLENVDTVTASAVSLPLEACADLALADGRGALPFTLVLVHETSARWT